MKLEKEKPKSFDDIARTTNALAKTIAQLSPKDLAALRKTKPGESGSGTFWRLYHSHEIESLPGSSEAWEMAVQAIAILTPTGNPSARKTAHDPEVSLGYILKKHRISETRVLRMLSQNKEQRRVTIVRLMRRLSTEKARFDLRLVVRLFLFDGKNDLRQLARDFYRHHDTDEANQSI